VKNRPNILVSPLNWGIGHATRCVPIILELLAQNANVIVASSGRSKHFLEREFPQLKMIDFPDYFITYPEKGFMAVHMARKTPAIMAGIKKENKELKFIIKEHKISAVISDNRYGLYSDKIPCIFMTHQVFIQIPGYLSFLKPLLEQVNKKFINKFSECWIPDFNHEKNLSGELSHKNTLPTNFHFIGPLSRFKQRNENKTTDFTYQLLVMLSGPEPQRTILEELLLQQLSDTNLKAAMVCGKTENLEKRKRGKNIQLFSHLESDKLKELILDSEVIISRPGYSTVMDLVALNKKAIFIPTPGQTEQEYLSGYYKGKGFYYSMKQKNLDLSKAFNEISTFRIPEIRYDDSGLKSRIKSLLEGIS